MNFFDILQNFLRFNKNIKLEFREGSSTLDIFNYTKVILSLDLDNTDIKDNAKYIYESIVALNNITMYIPKIYTK